MISPTDHYRLHETVAIDATALKAFIDQVSLIGEDSNCDVYWRGQADSQWGVLSSLARIAHTPTGITDADLGRLEQELLTEARGWVTAPFTPPAHSLEWLALLQHHGVPTRMVDFTQDPLIATFFAVESMDDRDGRLVAVAIPKTAHVSDTDAAALDIGRLPLGELRMWAPRAEVSPRLAAQHGVFAIGRLPSTTPARSVAVDIAEGLTPGNRLMTRSEVVAVTSIPLYFVKLDQLRRAGSRYPSAFTARIHFDKSSVREQLARRTNRGALRPTASSIDYASCYPDVDGMQRFSPLVRRLRSELTLNGSRSVAH